MIRDPQETNRMIWLRKKELHHMGKRKGRLVQIKRLLYYFEYDASPSKQIKNYCGEKYCVNPSHCYVPGVERGAGKIGEQVENGTLSYDDAREWGLLGE